jgi:xanthine dehydrogenase accessory factor
MDFVRVLQFLKDCQKRGEPSVLVTVCAVEGSSMRGPGTIMGVAQDGSFAGSLSGGCIENAVVAEALEALEVCSSRLVRFGAGSPYLDIKLPCGGGLDVHFCPLEGSNLPQLALEAVAARRSFSLRVTNGSADLVSGWQKPSFDPANQTSTFGHWPVPRIAIIGHGAGVEALAVLGQTMGCDVETLTSDEGIIKRFELLNIPATRLDRPSQTDLLNSDPWTAFVFLFHDHDWELDLMERAFALPHFYFGAMGGKKAHVQRSEALRARGIMDAQLTAMRAPIGLFHSSRDPQTLALSTLAEIIRCYDMADFEASLG